MNFLCFGLACLLTALELVFCSRPALEDQWLVTARLDGGADGKS